LDRRGDLYDRRNDLRTLTMRRILEPWIPKNDERLKALGAEGASSSASPPRYGAGKELSALAPGNSAAPFRPCASFGKRGPTRRAMDREIIRARLQIRVPVNGKGYSESSSSPEPDASSRRRRFDCSFGGRLICDMGFNWCGRHRGHTRINADSRRQAPAAAR
jgi:hypothetical protein